MKMPHHREQVPAQATLEYKGRGRSSVHLKNKRRLSERGSRGGSKGVAQQMAGGEMSSHPGLQISSYSVFCSDTLLGFAELQKGESSVLSLYVYVCIKIIYLYHLYIFLSICICFPILWECVPCLLGCPILSTCIHTHTCTCMTST